MDQSLLKHSGAVAVHWFRQDLRLADNPALCAAAQQAAVLPLFIHNPLSPNAVLLGEAGACWLSRSLALLNQSCDGHLQVHQGEEQEIFSELLQRYTITHVTWNRQYDAASIARDKALKLWLESQGVEVITESGLLLWEPWTVKKKDGSMFRVFTPFYRKGCLGMPRPRQPLDAPEVQWVASDHTHTVDDLGLEPTKDWVDSMLQSWTIGEQGAQQRLEAFLAEGIADYKDGRNEPSKLSVSRLSPYLHFGEISPQQIWYAVEQVVPSKHTDHFKSELGWREFSYYLMYHWPSFIEQNWQPKFDAMAWRDDPADLKSWQKGRTGIPFVDAAMRELWQTGYMHNRLRMVVGSFLVKNLLIDWRQGQAWFAHCLLDADIANNAAGWQWIAGTGADAAPYFRIFNPVTQGQNFDKQGAYTRRYVPELAQLPDKYLFNPWEAPAEVLAAAGVHLGVNYPRPIVDLRQSRERALAAFTALKSDKV